MALFKRKKKIEENPSTRSAPSTRLRDSVRSGSPLPLDAARGRSEKVAKPKPAKSVKTDVRRFSDVDRILVKPLLTEKISEAGMYNQYAFEVKPNTNKIQIKKAIETYYKVKPVRVNIVNVRGRSVRWGRTQGKTRAWKKAIVTLRAGDKIEVYEGV